MGRCGDRGAGETFLQLQVSVWPGWEGGAGSRLHWPGYVAESFPRAQDLHGVLSICKIPLRPLLCEQRGEMGKEESVGNWRNWEERMLHCDLLEQSG